MREYETMLVFRPDVEDEKRDALLQRFRDVIGEAGEVNLDQWGLRKLAYLIDDYPEGYYVLMTYHAEPEIIKELNRIAGISDVLLRYMTIAKEN